MSSRRLLGGGGPAGPEQIGASTAGCRAEPGAIGARGPERSAEREVEGGAPVQTRTGASAAGPSGGAGASAQQGLFCSGRNAFTLIEVAVAGSLITLCVLSALGIIPSGLRIQNEARMRAVAAATVMRLSAEAGAENTVRSRLTAVPAATLRIERWDSKGVVTEAAPSDAYRIEPLPAAEDLSRRLVFTLSEGERVRLITAWLLNRDPASADAKRATYLATFTEAL